MQYNRLLPGDTIGLVSPSHVAEVERYQKIISAINALGFRVKTGQNLYKATYGYLASEAERAADFNQMILDDEVKMVFFGGGYGALELLPLIDYEAIRRRPKLFMSYSDGTSILNAIHAKTGQVTHYGQSPGLFDNVSLYDFRQFEAHFIKRDAKTLAKNSPWHSLHPGVGEGVLIGGYTWNFALLINGQYLSIDSAQKYILFLEDHERFTKPAGVSMLLSHIEQGGFIQSIAGLLFGHYAQALNPELMGRLSRFGERHHVPVIYCDDFGHGANHAILPIGARSRLDADACTLSFLDA